MTDENTSATSRRDFLTGRAIQTEIERAGDALADRIAADDEIAPPTRGDTLRLETRAMACDFAVVMNPGRPEQIRIASEALDMIHALEAQLTVYRPESELSHINRHAGERPVEVEPRLFELLLKSRDLCRETGGGFDPTSGPLIALWRECRQDGRIPGDDEIAAGLARTGIEHIEFDEANRTVRYHRPGVELNLGGIGKGYALDRAGQAMSEQGLEDFLFHGGHSSLLARGDHNQAGGWPVGIRDPLFPDRNLATLVLKDRALSSSGSGVQHFRHGGKRYGHILDPRSGRPVEGVLSVTVVAPTAAEADALSTAFFVMGLEKARDYCHNQREIGAILIPPPRRGRTLEPIVCGISDDILFWIDD